MITKFEKETNFNIFLRRANLDYVGKLGTCFRIAEKDIICTHKNSGKVFQSISTALRQGRLEVCRDLDGHARSYAIFAYLDEHARMLILSSSDFSAVHLSEWNSGTSLCLIEHVSDYLYRFSSLRNILSSARSSWKEIFILRQGISKHYPISGLSKPYFSNLHRARLALAEKRDDVNSKEKLDESNSLPLESLRSPGSAKVMSSASEPSQATLDRDIALGAALLVAMSSAGIAESSVQKTVNRLRRFIDSGCYRLYFSGSGVPEFLVTWDACGGSPDSSPSDQLMWQSGGTRIRQVIGAGRGIGDLIFLLRRTLWDLPQPLRYERIRYGKRVVRSVYLYRSYPSSH